VWRLRDAGPRDLLVSHGSEHTRTEASHAGETVDSTGFHVTARTGSAAWTDVLGIAAPTEEVEEEVKGELEEVEAHAQQRGDEDDRDGDNELPQRRWGWIPNCLPEIVCGLVAVSWCIALRWQRVTDPIILLIAAAQVVVWNNLLTIPHEIGHALMARLVGAKVLMVRLGSGRKLGVVQAFGIPWHVHLGIGGLSYSQDVVPDSKRFRLRNWMIIAAGPGTNLLLAACGMVLGRIWGVDDLFPKEGYAVVQAFVVANLIGALVALWPWTMYQEGEEFPTDGRQLLTIPWMTDEEVEEAVEQVAEEVARGE
jgi:hypothetical protein